MEGIFPGFTRRKAGACRHGAIAPALAFLLLPVNVWPADGGPAQAARPVPVSRETLAGFRFQRAAVSGPGPNAYAEGNIAVIEDDGSLIGHQNLFNLDNSTVRFTPRAGGGYTVDKTTLAWDSTFGNALSFPDIREAIGTREMSLPFDFPFAGRTWRSVFVNTSGSVGFGFDESVQGRPRFYALDDMASTFLSSGKLILAPLWFRFQPWLPSQTFYKELADRVVITWDVSEPNGGALSFARQPTRNLFQLTLMNSGQILFSYNGVDTRGGIVGLFPGVRTLTPPLQLSTNSSAENSSLPAHLDILSARLEQADDLNLRFTYTLRGNVPAPKQGLAYRFFVDLRPPFVPGPISFNDADCPVVVARANTADNWQAYHCVGETTFTIQGNQVSVLLPLSAIGVPRELKWYGDSVDFSLSGTCCWFDQIGKQVAAPTDFGGNREISFGGDLPKAIGAGAAFEAFHYPVLEPNSQALTKAFYQSFPDAFDFLMPFTSLRFDWPESGPRSYGALNTAISGIGMGRDGADGFGSAGRLQSGMTPSWLNGTSYDESGSDSSGPFTKYARALWLMLHEIGHRWLANLDFLDNGVRRKMHDDAPHWLEFLHAPSVVFLNEPNESSPMSGSFWVDNGGGSFTSYFHYGTPSAYSYLDLYAMGLMRPDEVPPFFLLDNVTETRFVEGRKVVRARRTNINIEQVIAAMGPRLPAAASSQKSFSTGFVFLIPKGARPSAEDLRKLNALRLAWENQFSRATLGRATMTTTLPAGPITSTAGVVHAASFLSGPVAPGQIISIFGSGIGPASPAGAALDSAGRVAASLAGVRVLIDDTPSPLFFAGAQQINAVVPYAVAGKTSALMRVEYQGVKSNPVTLAVLESAPAIFSAASGSGQVAMIHATGGVNSVSNPAAPGSVVTFFASGEGQTEPAGVDGTLAIPPLPHPRLPVSAKIGGSAAEILYAGAAPGFAGLMQVNVRVPAGAAAGGAVELQLTVGTATSQPGVTMAVR